MSTETAGAAPAAAVAPAVATPVAGQPTSPAAPVNVYFQQPAGQAQPPVPAAPTPTVAPPAPAGPQMVPIPLEQLQAFTSIQARLAEMETAQRSQQEAVLKQVQDAMLAKGQAEDAVRLIREQSDQTVKSLKDQIAEIERHSQAKELEVNVARAMAGIQFVNDEARRDFENKVRGEMMVQPNPNGGFVVRTATFQSAEQVVAEKVASGRYDYMLAPKGVSGTSTGQTPQAGPTPAANPAAPAVQTSPAGPTLVDGRPVPLGVAWMMDRKAAMAARSTAADRRLDPSRPMGFGAGSNVEAR